MECLLFPKMNNMIRKGYILPTVNLRQIVLATNMDHLMAKLVVQYTGMELSPNHPPSSSFFNLLFIHLFSIIKFFMISSLYP
jgi:hypothetical protein